MDDFVPVSKLVKSSDNDEQDLSISSSCSSSDSETENYRTPKNVKRAAKKRVAKEKKREQQKEKNRIGEKISKDDFYKKNQEFRTWVLEEKNKICDALSAEKQKDLFKKFVKKWNAKKLPKKYYRGIDLYLTAAPDRTTNRWSLAEPSHSDNWISIENVATPEVEAPTAVNKEESLPPSTPSTPFSTFGKHTPGTTPSVRTALKPLFVPSPVVPKRDPKTTVTTQSQKCDQAVTETAKDEVIPPRGSTATQGVEEVASITSASASGVQLRKRRYHQISRGTLRSMTQSIHAGQEVEKKKMKALMEMSRSARNSRASWAESSTPSDDVDCGYFRV